MRRIGQAAAVLALAGAVGGVLPASAASAASVAGVNQYSKSPDWPAWNVKLDSANSAKVNTLLAGGATQTTLEPVVTSIFGFDSAHANDTRAAALTLYVNRTTFARCQSGGTGTSSSFALTYDGLPSASCVSQ